MYLVYLNTSSSHSRQITSYLICSYCCFHSGICCVAILFIVTVIVDLRCTCKRFTTKNSRVFTYEDFYGIVRDVKVSLGISPNTADTSCSELYELHIKKII